LASTLPASDFRKSLLKGAQPMFYSHHLRVKYGLPEFGAIHHAPIKAQPKPIPARRPIQFHTPAPKPVAVKAPVAAKAPTTFHRSPKQVPRPGTPTASSSQGSGAAAPSGGGSSGGGSAPSAPEGGSGDTYNITIAPDDDSEAEPVEPESTDDDAYWAQTGFGTIGGKYSAFELSELIAAKDTEVANVQNAFDQFKVEWAAKDAQAFGAWSGQWYDFITAYVNARSAANTKIQSVLASGNNPNTEVADDEYRAVLRALQPVEHSVTEGSFQDLYNRLSDAGASGLLKQAEVSNPVPQPAKNHDVDLQRLQAVDTLIKQGESAARTSFPWVTTALVVGGVILAWPLVLPILMPKGALVR
jgi:hypothetical protein